MSRAVSSALGVLLVTALTLVLAAVAGVAVFATVPPTTASSADVTGPVVLSASADASTRYVVLVHESGPELDVRGLDVVVTVGGEPLTHQPPVPFFAASGFYPPTGPFNVASDPRWGPGERASFGIAKSNDPDLRPGVAVRVELYRGDLPVAAVETTAR